MMKKFLCSVTCVLLSLFVFASCQSQPQTAETCFDGGMQLLPESEKETSLEEWKVAYLDFIEKIKDSHETYALIFVDDDEIPELFYRGDCEAGGDGVCSYKKGKIVEADLYRIGGSKYIPKSGYAANFNGHMGDVFRQYYKLTEDGFELLLDAHSIEHVSWPEGYDPHEESFDLDMMILRYEYLINDKPATEEEYNTAVNDGFDTEKALEMDENEVAYDAIRPQIISYGKK